MVNLSYVMSEDIKPNQLMMRMIKGALFNDKKDFIDEQKYEEVPRTITNSKDINAINNVQFVSWSTEVSNEMLMKEGTANKYYWMTALCDTNTIENDGLDIVELSTDGIENKDTYKFDKVEFLGFEMDEDKPILMQKKIVSRFKTIMGYKQIFIEMNTPNYYLQRGTLVNVVFVDYESVTKSTTLYNNENIFEGEGSDELEAEDIEYGDNMNSARDALLNNQAGVTNLSLSGMYYISDMSFKYDNEAGELMQCMHLVKRGSRNNIINKSIPIHL